MAFSIKRASMKCWLMAFAISRVMEKVVVVVVVTTREGSLGSGPRFDCENFREARFCAASSVEKELGNVLKNCLCGPSWSDTIRVAKRSRVSFKKGLPRFVVFIIWDEVACASWSACEGIASGGGEKKRRVGEDRGRGREEGRMRGAAGSGGEEEEGRWVGTQWWELLGCRLPITTLSHKGNPPHVAPVWAGPADFFFFATPTSNPGYSHIETRWTTSSVRCQRRGPLHASHLAKHIGPVTPVYTQSICTVSNIRAGASCRSQSL